MPKVLIAAGGTGGHMFPAQAIAEILENKDWEITLITDARGQKYAERIPANHRLEVRAASISPRSPIKAISGVANLLSGTLTAAKYMKRWQPNVVIGFGGYPSYPAMSAATRLGIPCLIHEQNAVLGRVNRLFAGRVRYVASGFDRLDLLPEKARQVVTGNPLRAQIIHAIPKRYAAPKRQINLLIIGGSLGARLISEVMPAAVAALPDKLRKRINVVQQTREENLTEARRIYEQAGVPHLCEPFFSDIEKHLAAAHYVVGRAGASSVSEVAAMGKPALFVPLAIAMDNHQLYNAEILKSLNAADILPESQFTSESVTSLLEARLNDTNWLENAARNARQAAHPHAATKLAELVTNTAQADQEA